MLFFYVYAIACFIFDTRYRNSIKSKFTEKSGYFGKLFSKSKQHQIGFITRRKKLRKKSPTKICATVNTVSITVSLTSSCPNIVSQHSLRMCSLSLISWKYLLSASGQLSNTDSKAKIGFSPGEDNEFFDDLITNRLQIFFVQARSSRGIRPRSKK